MGVRVQDIIIDRILSLVAQTNRLPWQYPFCQDSINWFTEKPYRGINRILLGGGEWITRNQLLQYNKANDTSFWFPKGVESHFVVFYNVTRKELTREQYEEAMKSAIRRVNVTEENGKYFERRFVLRYYTVYPISCLVDKEGNHLPTKLNNGTLIEYFVQPEEIISAYMKRTGVQLEETQGIATAYYSLDCDVVRTPLRRQFKSTEAYYRTLFHEFVHSTGIESRLNRQCLKNYTQGKVIRSKEEVVAEVGAMILASECNFKEDLWQRNSEEYVAGWIEWIGDNKAQLINGMYAAEKAVNYILEGFEGYSDDEKKEK